MGPRAIAPCTVLFLACGLVGAMPTQDASPSVTEFPVIGIGGGAGGRFGAAPAQAGGTHDRARFAGRFADRTLMRTDCRSGAERALERGLTWLASQQQQDGSWKATSPPPAKLRSPSVDDAGLTGLALLAFLGNGDTPLEGMHSVAVGRALVWLCDTQDPETGQFGKRKGHTFLYNHAIATLAVAEAHDLAPSPRLEGALRRAVKLVLRARNPYGAWRYDVPPVGDNDTSVTGWMVTALDAAEHAGIDLSTMDDDAYEGALNWIDEVTEAGSGRVGYDSVGSVSSRVPAVNEHMPPDRGEAMTAVGLSVRILLGSRAERPPLFEKHAELLLKKLPVWDPEGFGCDMYYWYFGSHAMHQMGGEFWDAWHAATERALLANQVDDGDDAGSWDPIGPWGYAGGRVYSTALMALCLEAPFRYGRRGH